MDIREVLNQKSLDCNPDFRSTCEATDCALHDFCTMKIARKKMIRKYCLECTLGQPSEIRKCPSTDCPFYEFRMGK